MRLQLWARSFHALFVKAAEQRQDDVSGTHRAGRGSPASAGHMEKSGLPPTRLVEHTDRLGSWPQYYFAALFREKGLSFRREMQIAHLARAKDKLFASLLEDEFCFVFRERVRGAVVLLR